MLVLLSAMAAWFTVMTVGAVLYAARSPLIDGWLAVEPAVALVAAVVLLFGESLAPRRLRPLAPVVHVVLGLGLLAPFVFPGGSIERRPLIGTAACTLVFLGLRGLAVVTKRSPPRWAEILAGVGLCLALAALLPAGLTAGVDVNRHGLICFRPGSSLTETYAYATNKDGYPSCRFDNNSLGYRDVEPEIPPGRRVVLLVGDSFVWGDGIPTNAETLGQRLREALEARSPGRYAVVSAAYPGLDVYGYRRFVGALAPAFGARWVLIGYLGDHNPLDAQRLADLLPGPGPLRRLVLRSQAPRRLHARAAASGDPGEARALLGEIGRQAIRERFRAVLIAYAGLPLGPPPPGLEAWVLPPELRYPGHRNAYWYAADAHPKPALNAILGERLADLVVDGDRSPEPDPVR